jgi:asparagine synthase (glutamine-hydrolysing)
MATYADGELRVERYWDLKFDPDTRGIGEWAQETRQGVQAAVRRQMVSDVPVGAFLSGGIDSSAIAAEMADARDGPLPVYTAGFSSDDRGYEFVPDDAKYAREMAREIGAEHHERMLDADVVSLLPRLVWHMDEPIADPACITTYLICSAARKQLTVILSGMGGDEVFAGYPRHLAARLAGWLDALPHGVRQRLRTLVEQRMTMGGPGRMRGPRRNVMKLARGLDQVPSERFLTYCAYYTGAELGRLLSPEAMFELRAHDPYRRHREYFSRVAEADWVNQMLYVDMKTFLPCLNLAYTDRMSMAASTEVRVPLLDDEVVEMSTRIPAGLKLRGTTRKYVLKKSMEGVLPKEIIWRPKAGFGAPVRSWLDGDLKELMDDALSPARVKSRGWLDSAEVERLRKANSVGAEDNALRLWAILTLELWHQTFIDEAPAERVAA